MNKRAYVGVGLVLIALGFAVRYSPVFADPQDAGIKPVIALCTEEQLQGKSCEDPGGCANACARYCSTAQSCSQCCMEFASYPAKKEKCQELCDEIHWE
jgi:hypothetical protein